MIVLDASALLAYLFEETVVGRISDSASGKVVDALSLIHPTTTTNFILQTQRYGLSLGDRACLGLAKERQLAVLTADTAWSH